MRTARALSLLFALALGAACGRSPSTRPDAPLETVEVIAKPDAAANLATDVVAAPRADESGVAGALPADFPPEVPLPEPSSVVDFSPHSVTFEVQAAGAAAQAAYLSRLRARGFVAAADGSWQKGARRIGVAFADASGATRITVEIR